MNAPLDETLGRVAEEAFEGLAFMLAMPDDEAQPGAAPSVAAIVAFDGPFTGELIVAVSDEMLPELAANMLGLEDGARPAPDKQRDALKELANVVCGHLLPAIAGPEAVFDVRAPRLLGRDRPTDAPDRDTPTATADLTLDAGRAALALFIDEAAQDAAYAPPPSGGAA